MGASAAAGRMPGPPSAAGALWGRLRALARVARGRGRAGSRGRGGVLSELSGRPPAAPAALAAELRLEEPAAARARVAAAPELTGGPWRAAGGAAAPRTDAGALVVGGPSEGPSEGLGGAAARRAHKLCSAMFRAAGAPLPWPCLSTSARVRLVCGAVCELTRPHGRTVRAAPRRAPPGPPAPRRRCAVVDPRPPRGAEYRPGGGTLGDLGPPRRVGDGPAPRVRRGRSARLGLRARCGAGGGAVTRLSDGARRCMTGPRAGRLEEPERKKGSDLRFLRPAAAFPGPAPGRSHGIELQLVAPPASGCPRDGRAVDRMNL
jgi:hypothetical protein